MSIVDTIVALASGKRPPKGALLPTCRLEGFGSDFYGEEAIVEAFRRQPDMLSPDMNVVAAESHVALFDGESLALLADVADGAVARLWRIGPGGPQLAEPAIAVAFDPDLTQARGDVLLAASSHPMLVAEAVERVAHIGRMLAGEADAYRARAFLVRAFSAGLRGAALFAVHRLAGTPDRYAGFAYAAAGFDLADTSADHVVRDRVGEAQAANAARITRLV